MLIRGELRKTLNDGFNRNFPQWIVTPVDCRRHVKFWQAANAIFIHVPKAAGTSISSALYGKNLGHTRALDIKRYAPGAFNSLFKFAYVRNPWDRLHASYHFVRQGGTSAVSVRGPERYQAPVFASFESFVHEWLSGQDLMQLDHVFMPQSAFVLDTAGTMLVDFLGRVENMDADANTISERIGYKMVVPVMNQVKKDIPYRDAYDSALKNAVGDIYRDDIALLGYDF
jgi:hypothetical protein